MCSMARNCSSRMYRLIRPIIFLEQIFLVLCHWKFVPVIHDRKESMLKKMSWEKNFKKVTKIFLRLLNERSRELKVFKIWKTKIFWEFEVAKCFKGGEISPNNGLNWIKILQFLITNPKTVQAVNKVEWGK